MIGGQRVAPRRRNNQETTQGTRTNLPQNSGFRRYYTLSSTGIELGPQAVLLLAVMYMGGVVILHIVSRIKTAL